MKKAVIIYNPTAGRRVIRRHISYITGRLLKAGYSICCHETTGPGNATKAADLAAHRGYDFVIAAGGDGTLFEVINGLAEKKCRPVIGIIPAGTSNNFAKSLGIHYRIEEVCNILCYGDKIPVDIGKANNKYFVNVAAGGMFTDLTYEVPTILKTLLGRSVYYLKGVEKLPYIKPVRITVDYDGHIFEGSVMFFLIFNTGMLGGFSKIVPESSFNDGKFDLLLVREMSKLDFTFMLCKAKKGAHLRDPRVEYLQAARIKVISEQHTKINLDGEYGGVLPGEFINLRHHLEVLAPRD